MKILNLYAGIGGNRKMWGEEHSITAVELNPQIAKIYQDFFPNDKVIVADAHQYLLDHFKEFEFIWSSPPCPSHSRSRFWGWGGKRPIYPDMKLYQEILFLQHYSKNKWVIENVMPFYTPLIPAKECHRHLFWSNFLISDKQFAKTNTCRVLLEKSVLQKKFGFNLDGYSFKNKRQLLRNCVIPELGLHILNESKRDIYPELFRKDTL